MSDKTRMKIVFAIVMMVMPLVVWSVLQITFGSTQWFDKHWQFLCFVMGAAAALAMVGVGLMLRADKSPIVKTVAACAVLATVIVTPAQAGDPNQYEDYAAYNVVAKFWAWVQANFTMGDFVQGITTSNQPTPQALANDAAAAFGGPVPAPSGPATPTVYRTKEK